MDWKKLAIKAAWILGIIVVVCILVYMFFPSVNLGGADENQQKTVVSEKHHKAGIKIKTAADTIADLKLQLKKASDSLDMKNKLVAVWKPVVTRVDQYRRQNDSLQKKIDTLGIKLSLAGASGSKKPGTDPQKTQPVVVTTLDSLSSRINALEKEVVKLKARKSVHTTTQPPRW